MSTREHTYEYDQREENIEQPEILDVGALALLNKSEIDQQIATAKAYPRSIKKFRDEALQLATLDEQTSTECIYALPRDGKVIEGPSARFAEILAYSWGNSRAGARVIGEDAEFVTSQGMFFDLEKNVAISYEVKRRITNKHGKRYNADMIGTTSNAASSIAMRNAVLKGIPKALWKGVYEAARKVVAGDFKTLANRREDALQSFVVYGVTPDMIYKTLGIGGKEDIGLDQLVALKGFLNALKDGESSVEGIFGNPDNNIRNEKARTATDEKTRNLVDKYQKPANGAPGPSQNEQLEQAKAAAQVEANTLVKPVSFRFLGTTVTVEPETTANPQQTPAEQTEAQPPASAPEHGTEEPQHSSRSGKSRQQTKSDIQGVPLKFDRP